MMSFGPRSVAIGFNTVYIVKSKVIALDGDGRRVTVLAAGAVAE
jgi:hypothetical protein